MDESESLGLKKAAKAAKANSQFISREELTRLRQKIDGLSNVGELAPAENEPDQRILDDQNSIEPIPFAVATKSPGKSIMSSMKAVDLTKLFWPLKTPRQRYQSSLRLSSA